MGGAAFVASLLLTGWWYFVPLGRPRQAGGAAPILYDAMLVALFAFHHSLFARESVKRALTLVPASMQRSLYVSVASVLLMLVVRLWQPVGGVLYAVHGPPALPLAAVQLAGFVLIVWAVAGLDPLELSGIRQATGADAKVEPLQVGGPYRLVRHPLYLGWILTVFGVARMTGDRLAFALMTTAYLFVAVPWEERSLVRSFGQDYARYRTRVRWRIIPFVY